MKVKPRVALSGLAALLPLTLSAQAYVYWTGAAAPDSDWSTSANWDTALPSLSDHVTIDTGYASVSAGAAEADTLTVGDTDGSTATLDITGPNGVLTVSTQSILGYGVGSSGTATVSGAGAVWNTGNLVVGTFGQGALTISDGGVVNSADVDLASGNANGPGTTQGTVLVTGAGSQWNATGSFKVGGYVNETLYNSASLTVADGGTVTVGTGAAGTLTIYDNGIVHVGAGGLAGALSATVIEFDDSGYIDDTTTPNAAAPALAFDHTDDVTFGALLSGYGLVTKAGSGTLTLTGNGVADRYDAGTFGGYVEVSGGTLVLDVNGYWDGDNHGEFAVAGSDSVLRIASGTTLANDLYVTDGTVEVAGALDYGYYGNVFTDATLHVLSGGEIIDGYFVFYGHSVFQIDAASGVAAGEFTLLDTSSLLLNATGAMSHSDLTLVGGVSVTLGADQALDNTAVLMIPDPNDAAITPTINLAGHSVTIAGLAGEAGEIVNNSATDVTVTIDVGCGCFGPSSYFSGTFSERSTGKIGVSVVGGAQFVIRGIQTYTGPTIVDASALYVISVPDENSNLVRSELKFSPITLKNGGVLGGDSIVHTVTIEGRGMLAPGDIGIDLGFAGVGTLTTGSITIVSDAGHSVAEHSGLVVDIYDATALSPGVGTDFLSIQGDLTFSDDPLDTFTVYVRSLGDGDDHALNFDANANQSWKISSVGGTIFNFDASRIFVDASYFTNALGLWSVTRGGLGNKDIYLHFAPIPEPATYALLTALAIIPVFRRRRPRA